MPDLKQKIEIRKLNFQNFAPELRSSETIDGKLSMVCHCRVCIKTLKTRKMIKKY